MAGRTHRAMKIAIVTGAGSGIGRAVALTLARWDYTVVLAGRRREALDSAVGEAAGGRAVAVTTDVADPKSVEGLFETTRKRFGRLDLLFNNAGTFTPAVPIEEITAEQWQAIVATNLSGAFY